MADTSGLRAAAMLMRLYLPQVEVLHPKALSGDRPAGLRMLAIASGLVAAGYPMPPKLQEWIATGLRRLSQGMPAEEAFRFVKMKRGERSGSTNVLLSNDRQVRALLVALAVEAKGMTIEDAWAAVANLENVSDETVRTAWTEGKDEARRHLALNPEWVEFCKS